MPASPPFGFGGGKGGGGSRYTTLLHKNDRTAWRLGKGCHIENKLRLRVITRCHFQTTPWQSRHQELHKTLFTHRNSQPKKDQESEIFLPKYILARMGEVHRRNHLQRTRTIPVWPLNIGLPHQVCSLGASKPV
jgi:hypothetical protein